MTDECTHSSVSIKGSPGHYYYLCDFCEKGMGIRETKREAKSVMENTRKNAITRNLRGGGIVTHDKELLDSLMTGPEGDGEDQIDLYARQVAICYATTINAQLIAKNAELEQEVRTMAGLMIDRIAPERGWIDK